MQSIKVTPEGPRFGQKRAENEYVGNKKEMCSSFVYLFSNLFIRPFHDLTLAQRNAFFCQHVSNHVWSLRASGQRFKD